MMRNAKTEFNQLHPYILPSSVHIPYNNPYIMIITFHLPFIPMAPPHHPRKYSFGETSWSRFGLYNISLPMPFFFHSRQQNTREYSTVITIQSTKPNNKHPSSSIKVHHICVSFMSACLPVCLYNPSYRYISVGTW